MKQFITENKIFLSLYLMFLFAGAVIIVTLERGNDILYFNELHTAFFDRFFAYVTRLAEMPMVILIIVIALKYNLKNGTALAINSTLVFVLTEILKRQFFGDHVRPVIFFESNKNIVLHFVEGVNVLRYNSFPSGHTSSAFALFFLLSIFLKDKRWSILFFFLALLVGISRVYLLEHFFRDVYGGSVVGVTFTILFYFCFVRAKFFANISWRNKTAVK